MWSIDHLLARIGLILGSAFLPWAAVADEEFRGFEGGLARSPTVVASDASLEDEFGRSVAIDGQTMVVGAPKHGLADFLFGSGEGAVYVFEWNGTRWVETGLLKGSNALSGNLFGHSVALSGDTLVVGAPNEGTSPGGPAIKPSPIGFGAVYVFRREAGVWVEESILRASNAGRGDRFGGSVAISGDRIVVGADSEDSDPALGEFDGSLKDSGASYVFDHNGDSWEQEAVLKATTELGVPRFGSSVAVFEDTILIGAPGDLGLGVPVDGSANDLPGAAFVFQKEGETWFERARLSSDTPAANDQFGLGVALCGDAAVIGARNTNAAWIYRKGDTGQWDQEARLDGFEDHSLFGETVAIGGGAVAISARWEADNGAVHVYCLDGESGSWRHQIRLSDPDGASNDEFSAGLAIHENTVAIGAPLKDFDPPLFDAGAIFVFAPPAADVIDGSLSVVLSDTAIQLRLPTHFGRTVGLEFSPDLSEGSWIELGNFSESGGELVFNDSDDRRLRSSRGFYRAFLRPLGIE